MIQKYEDMIHLPHHVSATHPPMDIINRAAQFSPFAALTGYESAIRETARLTDARVELDEDMKETLRDRIQIIVDKAEEGPRIEVTYFQPDEKKDGGAYVTVIEMLKKIDLYKRILIMKDGNRIPINDIVEIGGDIFEMN
jgi:hypothetical protein